MFPLELALCVDLLDYAIRCLSNSSCAQKVAGFPTIKFRAANTDEWVDYEGDRSVSLPSSVQCNTD